MTRQLQNFIDQCAADKPHFNVGDYEGWVLHPVQSPAADNPAGYDPLHRANFLYVQNSFAELDPEQEHHTIFDVKSYFGYGQYLMFDPDAPHVVELAHDLQLGDYPCFEEILYAQVDWQASEEFFFGYDLDSILEIVFDLLDPDEYDGELRDPFEEFARDLEFKWYVDRGYPSSFHDARVWRDYHIIGAALIQAWEDRPDDEEE